MGTKFGCSDFWDRLGGQVLGAISPSAIRFMYSGYMQRVALVLRARIFLAEM